MSLCLYLYFLDLVSLMPSMIEAWFSSSDKITSSGPQICQRGQHWRQNRMGR